MKISRTINHGKTRWRVNVQLGAFRKRLFFPSREAAETFVAATGGQARQDKPGIGWFRP